ncbi:hypothetical protein Droror1_Dr00008618 [Drosera rotundifolia]
MKKSIKWGSSACAPTAITLLVVSLVLSVGFVSAVPASRSMNFVVQAPSIRDLCAQGMMDMWVCSKKIRKEEGRMLIDVNDYPDPGPNPGHEPPPPPASS